MKLSKNLYIICVFSLLFSVACEDDLQKTGPIGKILKNDCLKRSIGPNVVGNEIEFVYAMALPRTEGKILSASVEASIAGAEKTYMEHRSAHADGSGADAWVTVGSPCINSGGKTEVTFIRDTCAAALRYYYIIPEAAKGKDVSFTFKVSASNGETVAYKMGPYKIAKMDMKLDLPVSNGDKCFISLADMTVYTQTEAAANAAKIDLVYLYRSIPGITFGHAFVSPSCDSQYRPDVSIPSGVNNSSLIRKVYGLRDRHLARGQWGIYVDDIDLQTLDFANMPNYVTNMTVESGLWVETQDRAYRAYIYVNSTNTNGSAVISMKRLAMK